MTRRWKLVTTLTLLPSLALSLVYPGLAAAQPSGQPVDPPPPAAPVAREAPAAQPSERPMRFILTGGTVVIGARVSEDTEFFTVNTANGLVRVRKTDIASMDYNTGAGAPAPVVQAAAPAYPAPAVSYAPVRPARPGRGLVIAGTIIFSISYGLTVFGATIASVDNENAFLLFVPVAGPLLFGAVDETEGEAFALLLNLSLVQGAGLVMLILGLSKRAAASETETALAAPNQFELGSARVRVDPVLTSRVQGLAFSGSF